MNYLVFDTETSGLFDFSKPADAPGQPRLAHLGMYLVDESLGIESEASLMVRPDGWTMPDDVAAIHGLTQEKLLAEGRPIAEVLDQYQVAVAGRAVVAFNAQYDLKVMRGELRRAGRPDNFEDTPNLCMMRALIGVCKLPKAAGNGFKFPKLSEALSHFNIPQGTAHAAMDDARGCLDLFRMAKKIGVCPEPAVHHAKEGTKAGKALETRKKAEAKTATLGLEETLPLAQQEIPS